MDIPEEGNKSGVSNTGNLYYCYMGLFGDETGELETELNMIEEQVTTLESHLNAVDAALQDVVDNYQSVLTDEMSYQEHELDRLREIIRRERLEEDDVDEIKRRLRKLEQKFSAKQNEKEVNLEQVLYAFKYIRRSIKDSKEEIGELENRIDDLENEFYMYRNNKEYDFEKKLDERDYYEDKKDVENELARLRASMNALADAMDEKDKIKVE